MNYAYDLQHGAFRKGDKYARSKQYVEQSERIIMTHKSSKLFKEERIFLLLWIGTLLLVLGLGIWSYAGSVIKNKEQLLSGNLPPDQRNEIQGSLQWWKNTQIKLYNPAAFVLITTGTICTASAFILMATQLTRKTRKPS